MLHNPYIAIPAAALGAWIFGAIWYGALSKPYQRALGLDPEQCKGQKMPVAPLVACLAAELVMAFIFSRLLSGLGVIGWQDGAVTGLLAGIGVIAPAILVNNMFQQRKAMLTVIDGAHWIGVAVIEGALLAALA